MNTARSPAAEYLSKWLKETKFKEDLKDVHFNSAGLYSYYKTPQEGTSHYLESKGIDFSDFRGKVITEELIKKQDLILGFEEKWHIRKLKRRFKNLKELDKRIFLLLDFAGEKGDLEIPDPINFEPEEYRTTIKRIEKALPKVLQKIIDINKTDLK
ncbi:MAG: hypothetical protein ACFFFB_06290 [Candidatus Heimdallarchaeota archaeon]